MQIVSLVNQTAGSAITGTSATFRPVNGFTCIYALEVKRTASGTGGPTTTTTVALQGSLDGVDWLTIDSVALSSTSVTNPIGTSNWDVEGGYRTYVKVVQGMPLMRVCSNAAIGANHTLIAYIANG